jgi:hypothetical protein
VGRVIPNPPEHVEQWPGATACWYRIIGRLMQRCAWLPIYESMTALTAVECAMYRRTCQNPHPVLAERCEQTRQTARAGLAEMGWLSRERQTLTLLNADGHDVEIMDITSPLPPEDAAA